MRRLHLSHHRAACRGLLLALACTGCGGGARQEAGNAGATLAGAWQAVRAEVRAVDSLATAGDVAGARHHARTLYETSALLPGLSGAYVSTRQGPLTYALRDMQALVDSLRLAADAGDTVRVWREARKLQRTVAYIGGLYPTGILPGAHQTPGGAYARPADDSTAALEPRFGRPRRPMTVACPMDTDVRRTVPPDSVGLVTCPKCGMTLEPVGERMDAPPPDTAAVPTEAGGSPHRDHHAKHGGQFAMQGDYHLELVTGAAGQATLYVYDAWTRPLALAGARAELELEADGAGTRRVPLGPVAGQAGALQGTAGNWDGVTAITARVALPRGTVEVTFPLAPAAPAGHHAHGS